MNKIHFFNYVLFFVAFAMLFSCADKTIKKLDSANFQKFNFEEHFCSIKVIEYYPFTGNKLFTKNWSNIYLCREDINNDTILLLELKREVPEYISEREYVLYLILNNEIEKCPDEVSVTYPDSITFSKNYKAICARLGFLYD